MAEIWVRPGSEGFRMVPHGEAFASQDRKAFVAKPADIAKAKRLIFSMDGDYYLYRVGRARSVGSGYPIGVEIRAGELLFDRPASPKRNTYPPLDMLALFPDGDMAVYKANELTAQDLLALGARDVLSFGPILVRDGQIDRSYTTYGTSLQPRAGIGMFEKGHYLAIIVEGRIKASQGMTCLELAELFAKYQCPTAFNLDGGWTSAMVFMGRQLNQLDKSGVKDNAREQSEVMGIGQTAAFHQREGTP
ncbi:MAG: phosphodiester glycosidase family protein [Christensenellales bacterium]